MATNVLTTGNTAATSSEIAATVGTPITFYLKGEYGSAEVPAAAYVWLQVESDDATWINVRRLSSQTDPFYVLDATGKFRFNREEQTYEIGVFRGD